MNKTELKTNNVVVLENGKQGVVVGFNNLPTHIIFATFTSPISKYNDDLTHQNTNYNIVKVLDGSKATSETEVRKFITSKKAIADLNVLWEKEK